MIKTGVSALIALAGFAADVRADVHTQQAWATWSSSVPIEGRLGFSNEFTSRSADGWSDLRSVELRPGLTWTMPSGFTLSGGVGAVRTREPGHDLTERRIWQQFAFVHPVSRVRLTHRVRLEERFIERTGRTEVHASRLRYQARALVPLRSAYAILQEEVMFHVAGASGINGHAFDQSRLLAGIGRRVDRTTDVELAYLEQFSSGRSADTRGHIVQMTLTTRF